MYREEYEKRGFPIRGFLVKLILGILLILLLIWLVPKFVKPVATSNKNGCSGEICEQLSEKLKGLDALTATIFANNIDKMKNAAISYYTNERLPKNIGDSTKMSLREMISKHLLTPLVDKSGKAVDVDKSYVEITKYSDEYILKVNIKDSSNEDYILVHLGCYNYCNSYLCESKNNKNINIKSSKENKVVIIKRNGGDKPRNNKPGNNNPAPTPKPNPNNPAPTPTPNPNKPTPTPTPTPNPKPKKYIYEYKKVTGATFSKWSNWSNWGRVSCEVKEVNCNENDIKCLYKRQLTTRREKIGQRDQLYTVKREEQRQIGSYRAKSCEGFNYVEVNNTMYATTTNTRYETINTLVNASAGGWAYVGRVSFDNPPADTAFRHYKLVGGGFPANCDNTCRSLPRFTYEVYEWQAGLTQVSSTASTTSTSSSTSNSSSNLGVTCNTVEKIVPIYKTYMRTEILKTKANIYGDVCYMSEKNRTITSSTSTSIKWSKYNDIALISQGYYYTGNYKEQ